VNSCATIVKFIAENLGMNVPVLEDYVTNRDMWLMRIGGELNLDKHLAKDAVIGVMYGKSDKRTYDLARLTDEVESIRAAAVNEPTLSGPFRDAGLNDRQIFARIVFRLERRITVHMANEFKVRGYGCSALLHDGILVCRRQRLPNWNVEDEPLDPDTVASVQESLRKTFGIHIQIREKSQKPTTEMIRELIESARVVRNEGEAAQEIILHKSEFIANTKMGLAVYHETLNTWSFDEKENILELQRMCQPLSDRLTSPKPRRKNFLREGRLMENVVSKIAAELPVDHDWIKEADVKCHLKICYENGYFDMQEGRWVGGKCPEMRFCEGVRGTLFARNEEEVRAAHAFITTPFKDMAVANYYVKGLARAIAGDVSAKVAFIIISETNGGKSTTTLAVCSAFDGIVSQFDAGNLCNKPRADDRSKTNKWVGPIARKHLVIANEIPPEHEINFNSVKSFVSGGKDEIVYRLLNKNEVCVCACMGVYVPHEQLRAGQHSHLLHDHRVLQSLSRHFARRRSHCRSSSRDQHGAHSTHQGSPGGRHPAGFGGPVCADEECPGVRADP